MTVPSHLTAADTNGPFVTLQIKNPVFWDSILLQLPGRGCTFPTLKPQAIRFLQQLLIFWCPKPDAMLRFLLKKNLVTIKCCYSHGTILSQDGVKKILMRLIIAQLNAKLLSACKNNLVGKLSYIRQSGKPFKPLGTMFFPGSRSRCARSAVTWTLDQSKKLFRNSSVLYCNCTSCFYSKRGQTERTFQNYSH